jgi:hypothetical protein
MLANEKGAVGERALSTPLSHECALTYTQDFEVKGKESTPNKGINHTSVPLCTVTWEGGGGGGYL